MAKQEGLYRKLITESIVCVSLVLYVIPVTIISMVVSASSLKAYIPWIAWLCDYSGLINSMVSMSGVWEGPTVEPPTHPRTIPPLV